MTREQIEKQADDYMSKATPSYVNSSFDKYAIAQAFEEGAYWALEHQWVNVEDKLPENDNSVLVMADNCPYIAWFNETKKEWHEIENGKLINPTHWMKIPELKTTCDDTLQ